MDSAIDLINDLLNPEEEEIVDPENCYICDRCNGRFNKELKEYIVREETIVELCDICHDTLEKYYRQKQMRQFDEDVLGLDEPIRPAIVKPKKGKKNKEKVGF